VPAGFALTPLARGRRNGCYHTHNPLPYFSKNTPSNLNIIQNFTKNTNSATPPGMIIRDGAATQWTNDDRHWPDVDKPVILEGSSPPITLEMTAMGRLPAPIRQQIEMNHARRGDDVSTVYVDRILINSWVSWKIATRARVKAYWPFNEMTLPDVQ
jgi:hypothetical protein